MRDVSKILWQKSRKKILFSVFRRRVCFKVVKKQQKKFLKLHIILCRKWHAFWNKYGIVCMSSCLIFQKFFVFRISQDNCVQNYRAFHFKARNGNLGIQSLIVWIKIIPNPWDMINDSLLHKIIYLWVRVRYDSAIKLISRLYYLICS